MLNVFLFSAVVFVWGTTWIAIAFQIGEVDVVVSVFYRFALAALIMLAVLAAFGKLQMPARWRFVIVQALCLFCFNFISFYNATALIPSGLAAVIFSLASIFNAVNARIFYGERIKLNALVACVIGMAGITLLFWRDLIVTTDIAAVEGISWAVLGTLFFSLGNMASRRNNAEGVNPVTANAWGMGIGSLVLLVLVVIAGKDFTIPDDTRYWASLLYLAIPGSIIAFTMYLTMVKRIGAVRAGYATVLFPVVALVISTFFEGYQWHWSAFVGLALCLLGNVVMFVPWSKLRELSALKPTEENG